MKKRDIYMVGNQRVPGVTSITGVLDKPALMYWAVNMALDSLRGGWEPGKPYDSFEIEKLLLAAKDAHKRKKTDAGDFGSNIHEIVESYIGGQLKPGDIKNDDEKRALDNFIIITKDWKWVAAEIIVLHDELFYGGTADGGAYLPDGTPVLMDVKTSNSCYPEHSLQIALYAQATPKDEKLREFWEEMRTVGEGRILHFNKERITWEILERDMKVQYPFIPHFRQVYEWVKMNRTY